MIKRPLVWMTVAFVLGICSGSCDVLLAKLLPIIVFLIILMILSFFIPGFFKKELFLWLLPAFFVWGSMRCRQAMEICPLEQYLTEERKAVVNGIVSDVTVYESYVRFVVTDASVQSRMDEAKEPMSQIAGDECYRILVYAEQRVEPGYRIELAGTLQKLKTAANPGQYDEESYWKAQGVDARMQADSISVQEDTYGVVRRWIEEQKERIQEGIYEALPEKEAGILNAILLADKGGLDEDVQKLYKQTGVSHILAVSGLHFSMIAMGSYRLLKKGRLGAKLSLLLGVMIVLLYGLLTGFGISVQRAAIMLLASFLAWVPGKTYDAPSALALAAAVILVRQPLQLFQAGFLLSFGAVIGILAFADYFKKCRLEFIGASASVQLVLIPVLLWFYYELPVYSLIFNLVLLPFMSLLLFLAVLIGLCGLFWPFAANFFAGGAYYLLRFYEWVCSLNEYLPGNMFCYGRPGKSEMVWYYVLLVSFWLLCRRIPKKRVLLFLTSFLVFLFRVGLRQGLQVSYLAVGQGDCAVLQCKAMTILVDAGGSVKNGGERILVPFLKYYGDTNVEYVFISHADTDHFCMLKELLEMMIAGECEVTLECLVMPAAGIKEEKYQQLVALAGQAGVKVWYIARGNYASIGGMDIYCLAPKQEERLMGTNENSGVLLIKTEQCQYLFTGDIDEQGEEDMIAWMKEIGNMTDAGKTLFEENKPCVLKVAHHGSRYSSGEVFLAWANPKLAIISCGEGNSYGHPHIETLERLEERESRILRTDERGCITIREELGQEPEVDCWR